VYFTQGKSKLRGDCDELVILRDQTHIGVMNPIVAGSMKD
jgi:hypothetical protein